MRHINMRVYLLYLVIMILSLSAGCQITDIGPTETPTQELALGICWYDRAKESVSWCRGFGSNMTEYTQEIHPEISLDDAVLQEKVQENTMTLPIDTEKAATAHAWAILPTLMDCDYLPAGWIPVLACHYTNDVWVFCYSDGSTDLNGVRDGTADVYVAENDGHIIFIYPTP